MAGSSEIEAVKEASDIVEEIGSRITLARAGTSFRALCPFHSEKSPSFYVSETMQRFKCFGCGETGDVFTFLEKYDGMTFGEALRHLADKAGITLERRSVDPKDAEREDALAVLELAKEYYSYLLNEHSAGQIAREYLLDRGVTAESKKIFSLGYALPQWDGFATYALQKKKLPIALVAQTGLIIQGRNGWYDRFRHRIIFPLRNARGVVVGFSGRQLPLNEQLATLSKGAVSTDDHQAKYINTPETTFYHKSQLLYGYAEHWQSIREKREIVLVEGEFDVISSSQAHISHVAGLKGSALTQEHVRLLARSVDTIILSLDSDSAGVEATKRAVSVLQQTPLSRNVPMDLRVSVVPDGKDPDDLARKDPKTWRETVKKSQPAYEFLIKTIVGQHDVSTAVGKQRILYELAPFISKIEHAIEKEHYVQLIAQLLGSSKDSVQRDFLIATARIDKPSRVSAQPSEKKARVVSTLDKVELFILFLWTHLEDPSFGKRLSQMSQREWRTAGASSVLAVAKDSNAHSLNHLVSLLADDLQQYLFEWHTQPEHEPLLVSGKLDSEWQRAWKQLQRLDAQEKAKKIGAELTALDDQRELTPADKKRQEELLRQLAEVIATQRPEA